jgi:hypothetical protein
MNQQVRDDIQSFFIIVLTEMKATALKSEFRTRNAPRSPHGIPTSHGRQRLTTKNSLNTATTPPPAHLLPNGDADQPPLVSQSPPSQTMTATSSIISTDTRRHDRRASVAIGNSGGCECQQGKQSTASTARTKTVAAMKHENQKMLDLECVPVLPAPSLRVPANVYVSARPTTAACLTSTYGTLTLTLGMRSQPLLTTSKEGTNTSKTNHSRR